MPTPTIQHSGRYNTVWGKVPCNPIQVTNAFSNDPADRPYQDVGFDGLTDDGEKENFQPYLNTLQLLWQQFAIYQNAQADPSG